MRGRIVSVMWLAGLVAACEPPLYFTGPSARPLDVSGVVREYGTERPLTDADITFTEVDLTAVESVRSRTSSTGAYTLALPHTGRYEVRVNGSGVGSVYVNGTEFTGALFTQTGNCAVRYGVVLDSKTLRPVAGASVGGRAVTGADGWYRIEFSCPDVLPPPGGTSVMSVTHASYVTQSVVLGRGVFSVLRRDIDLERR